MGSSRGHLVTLAVWLASIAGCGVIVHAEQASRDLDGSTERLADAAGGARSVRADSASGVVRWVVPADVTQLMVRGGDATAKAMDFIAAHGAAFAVAPADVEPVGVSGPDDLGLEHVRLRQLHRGVPVAGAELVVHLQGDRVTAVHGTTVAVDRDLGVMPSVGPDRAAETVSLFLLRRRGLAGVRVADVRLEIFDRDILEGAGDRPARLAWFVEARVGDRVRYAWVDAHTDAVLLEFEQTTHALDREVYDGGGSAVLPGVLVRAEDDAPVGDADADGAYDAMGDAYQLFLSRFGRDSWDAAGAPLVATVHHCAPDQVCGKSTEAYWDPVLEQLVFGDGMAVADDIVAHEFTHAVIAATAGLFSYMQSGALAESLADMFGEAVDLTNGWGSDEPTDRWAVGEDITNPELAGGVRDMMDPEYWGDPGVVGEVYCLDTYRDERGGVYWNCGVPNHAFALMVDGGFVGSAEVSGVGLDLALRIQYRALTTYLTSASNFLDYYDAVRTACQDLVGAGQATATDCAHVTDALQAVELDTPWPCQDQLGGPVAAQLPPLCADGLMLENVYLEDFEVPSNAPWASRVEAGANHWSYPPPAQLEFATSGVAALYAAGSDQAALSWMEMTADLGVPTAARLRFHHACGLDAEAGGEENVGHDLAVVRYSTDRGATWLDAGPLIVDGAEYNGAADSASDNPLAGSPGFVRDSYGYTASELDLSSLAGRSVRFAFGLATASKSVEPDIGWFVDDVRLYTCVACEAPPVPTGVTSTASEVASGEMYLVSWSDSEGADRYEIQEATLGDFSDATGTIVASASVAARHEVETDTTFHYRVRALRDCGESSDWSTAVMVTVRAEAAPTCSFDVTPTTVTFPAEGGVGSASVATDAACVWTVETSEPWITITSTAVVAGPGDATFTVGSYSGDTDRFGTVLVAGVEIEITQRAVPCLAAVPVAAISVTPSPAEIGETVTFTDVGTGERDVRQWSVDDGTAVVATSTAASFDHTFSSPGVYSVRLEVENCAGEHEATAPLRVVDPDVTPVVTALAVPSAVRSEGLAGTEWHTDVWLHNPCQQAQTLDVVFLPEDHDNTVGVLWALELDLPGRATAALTNVVDRLPGLGSGPVKGALWIEPVGSGTCLPVVSSRTANVTSDGTYGQYLAPVSVGPSRPVQVHLPGLMHDDRYRTNLLLLNLGDVPASVDIELLDPAGAPVGDLLTRWIPPRSSHQVVRVADAAGVGADVASFTLRVTSDVDTVAALASVVDNTTGDPTSVTEHACAHEEVFAPGVAHLAGLQGSVWRSDLAIHNAGHDSCSARLQFVPDDPGADRPFVDVDHMSPARHHLIEDVVAYLAGDVEAKGYLRLSSRDGGPVPRLTARTYNLVDDGGTFGQFIPSFGVNEMVHIGDRGVLPGVASSPDPTLGFRTNIGVLNASDGETLRLQLVLYAPDGSIAGTRLDFEVAPAVFTQAPLAQLLGLGSEDLAGTLEVRVLSGGPAGVYASIVDNRTQDPILVPATPVW
jgi:Zn-dependent metalloprotease/PKD repeat protein